MIPDFNEHGELPIGAHSCTLEECFERFEFGERRQYLCERLRAILPEARRCGFLKLMIGGSFTTRKDRPGDIDMLWITETDVNKDNVSPNCIKYLEDTGQIYGWSTLYLPIDDDHQRIQSWAQEFGYNSHTARVQGMIVINL